MNPGNNYEVRISAFNMEGESAQSDPQYFTINPAPSAPILSNRRVYSNGVDLLWTIPSGEISGYYLSIYVGSSTNGPRMGKFSLTNPYYSFMGGSATFTFVVNAYNCIGESPMSNSKTFTFSNLKSSSANESIESSKPNIIEIYPSLSFDQLFVVGVNNFEASIFSMEGKKVLDVKNANESIDISQLKQGIYIIQLKSEGYTTVQKFVKQ